MAIDFDTIQQEMYDYADYDIVNSVARARLFIVASRRWLNYVAGSASNQSSSLTYNVQQVQDNLHTAITWLRAKDRSVSGGPGSVRFLGAGEAFR